MARRNLDEWIEEHDHATPAHPVRTLWRNHFYLDGFFNTEGGMWVVLVNGLFFIPVMFAAFFYPLEALLTAVVMLVATFAGLKIWMNWERNHR
jgi:hypothetical protein